MRRVEEQSLNIFDVLPFMEAFPFDTYDFELYIEGTDFSDSGVSKILLNELGDFGSNEKINFFYVADELRWMVSFNIDHIISMTVNSKKVTQFSNFQILLDSAIISNDIELKLTTIKNCKKFTVRLENYDNIPPYELILYDILKMGAVTLSSEQTLGVLNLDYNRILNIPLSDNEKVNIIHFLNFRLNYIKIMLGIVIAFKIY